MGMSGLSGSLTPALTRTFESTANAGAGSGAESRFWSGCFFFLDTARTPRELLPLRHHAGLEGPWQPATRQKEGRLRRLAAARRAARFCEPRLNGRDAGRTP